MTNLLPPREFTHMRRYVREHFIATGSLVAIVCGIAALLALFPVYALVRGAEEQPDPAILLGALSAEVDREEIARARLLLRDLEPIVAATTSSLDILADVFEARPPGTVVTSISLHLGESGIVTLAGTSASREDITAYRDALARDARFKSVTVPIGVLTGTAGKAYTMTITGSF